MSNWAKKKPKEKFYPLDMSGLEYNLKLEGRQLSYVADALGLAIVKLKEEMKWANNSNLEKRILPTNQRTMDWLIKIHNDLNLKYHLERNKRILEGKGHPDEILMPFIQFTDDGLPRLDKVLPTGFTMEDYKKHSSDKL